MEIEVTQEDFDRLAAGIKFDYLSPERRAKLHEIVMELKEAIETENYSWDEDDMGELI